MAERSLGALFVVIALLSAGCGDAGGPGGQGPIDAADERADGQGSDGGLDSGAGGAGGRPDAEENRDGTSGADGPASDDRLFPLEVGRIWTYSVVSTYPSCPAGTQETRVVSTETVDGRAAFLVQGYCGESDVRVTGNVVETFIRWAGSGWSRFLDEPVAEGHSWTTTNGSATYSMTYHQLGTYGAYSDCWKVIQNVSYTSYWIYCRGVGEVEFEVVDLGGGTIHATLTDRNF